MTDLLRADFACCASDLHYKDLHTLDPRALYRFSYTWSSRWHVDEIWKQDQDGNFRHVLNGTSLETASIWSAPMWMEKNKKKKRTKKKRTSKFYNWKTTISAGTNTGLNYKYHNTMTSGCARCKLCTIAFRIQYSAGWLMMMVAFITLNSGLISFVEGLCSSNPCKFEFSVLNSSKPTTRGLTVPRSDHVIHACSEDRWLC